MVWASNVNGFLPLRGAQHKIIGFLAGSYNGIQAIASLCFTAGNNVSFNEISNARGNVSATTASYWGLKEVQYVWNI